MFRRAIWPMNFIGKGGRNEIPSVIEDFFFLGVILQILLYYFQWIIIISYILLHKVLVLQCCGLIMMKISNLEFDNFFILGKQ